MNDRLFRQLEEYAREECEDDENVDKPTELELRPCHPREADAVGLTDRPKNEGTKYRENEIIGGRGRYLGDTSEFSNRNNVENELRRSYSMDDSRRECDDYCSRPPIDIRKEVRKHLDNLALKERLNGLRYELSFIKITGIPERLIVASEFPMKCFPEWASRFVSEIADSLQVRIEAVAPALLAAIFIGARGNYMVEVKNDYQEALTAYIMVVMPSGGRKSAIVNYFRKPVNEIQTQLQIDFDANAISRKSQLEAFAAVKNGLKSQTKRELNNIESLEDIEKARKRLSEKLELMEREIQKIKVRPKRLIDSPTSKELAMEMVRQDEAIGIFEAEGGIWKHRVRPSEDNIYLKGFTMEPFGDETTERSVSMQRPCLSICSYVQEGVAEDLYSNDALKDDGLLPRILPVFVSRNDRYRDPNPRDVSDELFKIYSDKIRSLFSIQRPNGQEGERTFYVLKLAEEARKLWQEYATWIAARMSEGRFKDFEAFGEKLAGYAVRLAGALHLLKYDVPHEHKIDAETMAWGISLAEFFDKHAEVAFDKSHLQHIKYANKILKWIDRRKKREFTERDAQHGINRCTIEDIRAGLDVLERHGLIGRHRTANSTHCVVNPNYSSHPTKA